MRVLTDAEVAAELTPQRAVGWARQALRDHADGRLVAPPRAAVAVPGGRLTFTAGGVGGDFYGYRSYLAPGSGGDEQVVVVHEASSGAVRWIAVGCELGPRRTGAIGAVAVDALARADASVLAIVGTGRQAWAQLEAIATVRPLADVRCHSRTAASREAFAGRTRSELGMPCRATATAREAVEGADLVVLATSSPVAVIDPAWLAPGCFVSTLGPKQQGRAEFGPELVDAVEVAVTDSRDQLAGYDPTHVLAGTAQEERIVGLGDVLTGRADGRTSADQRALFISVGLAGTEAYLLARLLARQV